MRKYNIVQRSQGTHQMTSSKMKDAILARWNFAATHFVFSRKKLDVSPAEQSGIQYALPDDLANDLE